MSTRLFHLRPATRTLGNELISKATVSLLYDQFGTDTAIITVPAVATGGLGGFTARQVYDINRFADGVVLSGGTFYENGQLTFEPQALGAMRPPMLTIGVSHGRIYDRRFDLIERSDAMAPDVIRQLAGKAHVNLVRDRATQVTLQRFGIQHVELGGCPTLYLSPNPSGWVSGDRVLVSVRHPDGMSVPPSLQWRLAEDLRRLVAALKARVGNSVYLVCHEYKDIEFAAAFPEAPLIYFDDVERYVLALRTCRISIAYRLHAFLPCLAFGVPAIHLSYDERGKETVATAGMGEWDIDLLRQPDMVEAVMSRMGALSDYFRLRTKAQVCLAHMHDTTVEGIRKFAAAVSTYASGSKAG